MVKSLITSHNNTYTNDTIKRHIDFVNDIQAMFPWKEKHQVTNLYVELVVEMMTAQSNNQHVVARSAHVNANFGMPTEAPHMENMGMIHGYIMDDIEATRRVEGQQHMPDVVPMQRRRAVRFWTTDEHRFGNFCHILSVIFSTINKHVVFRIS